MTVMRRPCDHATSQAMGINLSQDDAPSTSHYTFSADGHVLGFYGEAWKV